MEIIIIFAAACMIHSFTTTMKPAEPEPWRHKKRLVRNNKGIETIKNI